MNLNDKYNRYLDLLHMTQDEHGFINSSHCDSLLFTGLLGSIKDVDSIDIKAAFDFSTGEWHRRPLDKPCFDCAKKENKGSKSSISRDMLLGLAWYAYHNKRLDISEQVISHALCNWGFMGEAEDLKTKWGRCQIMPPLFATFCWISYRLGGPSRAWARWIPADVGGQLDDFQAHLQVLHILLRSELTGKLSERECQTLKYQASRQPLNPLFLHGIGEDLRALKVLERRDLWPVDRLPRKSDRKSEWLPMRNHGPDWKPEMGELDLIPHSGADFLFLYWLISKRYKIKV